MKFKNLLFLLCAVTICIGSYYVVNHFFTSSNTHHYKYEDVVVVYDKDETKEIENQIINVEHTNDNLLQLEINKTSKLSNIKPGEIFILESDDYSGSFVGKIKSNSDRGQSVILEIEEPAIDEIFKELDYTSEQTFSNNDTVINSISPFIHAKASDNKLFVGRYTRKINDDLDLYVEIVLNNMQFKNNLKIKNGNVNGQFEALGEYELKVGITGPMEDKNRSSYKIEIDFLNFNFKQVNNNDQSNLYYGNFFLEGLEKYPTEKTFFKIPLDHIGGGLLLSSDIFAYLDFSLEEEIEINSEITFGGKIGGRTIIRENKLSFENLSTFGAKKFEITATDEFNPSASIGLGYRISVAQIPITSIEAGFNVDFSLNNEVSFIYDFSTLTPTFDIELSDLEVELNVFVKVRARLYILKSKIVNSEKTFSFKLWEFDTDQLIPPNISGIEENKTYFEDLTIHISDNSGIKKIELIKNTNETSILYDGLPILEKDIHLNYSSENKGNYLLKIIDLDGNIKELHFNMDYFNSQITFDTLGGERLIIFNMNMGLILNYQHHKKRDMYLMAGIQMNS